MLLKIGGAFLAMIVVALATLPAVAQQSFSLSVTPPLLQVTVKPGETFRSSLKIVNINEYDITVYTTPADFTPTGEAGQGNLRPIVGAEEMEEMSTHSLARWISITDEPITVPRQQSRSIEYEIHIPENAEPGGHYGAVLIGRQPPEQNAAGPSVSISTMVSSLMFVRVPGDIVEKGNIRDFTTGNEFYENPEVQFSLRFENTGNVHIQPQGDITIYNMWGKQRGYIPINQKTDFGNVLPGSTRVFEFDWIGEGNIFEVGRYRAEATLGYGDEARQSTTAATYFWVVPLRPTLMVLGSFLLFMMLLVWGVRRYIRRMIEMQRAQLGLGPAVQVSGQNAAAAGWTAPITEGVIDLRAMAHEYRNEKIDEEKTPQPDMFRQRRTLFAVRVLKRYAFFFVFITVFILGSIGMVVYFAQVLTSERSYEIVVHSDDARLAISSEEIIRDRIVGERQAGAVEMTATPTQNQEASGSTGGAINRAAMPMTVLNGGGIPGKAAEVSLALESLGYRIARLGNADSFGYDETVLSYPPEGEVLAQILAEDLGWELELRAQEDTEEMTLIIGRNYE